MTSSHRRRIAAFACAAALAVTACSGSGESGPEARVDVSAPSESGAPEISNTGAPALMQFTNALVGGGQLDASTLADKPTLFWFWSPT